MVLEKASECPASIISSGTLVPGFGERLKSIRQKSGLSQIEMNELLNIGKRSWQRYEKEVNIPGGQVFAALVAQGFNANWILTGQGPMLLADSNENLSKKIDELRAKVAEVTHDRDKLIMEALDRKDHPDENSIVEVMSLVESPKEGWQAISGTRMWAEAPADLKKDTGFAVIAVGDSMIPEGIKDGTICFCDKKRIPRTGDIVFIERTDGTASIRLFVGKTSDSVNIQGWLPQNESGTMEPVSWDIPISDIERLAVVLWVKRAA